jgi:hypothetical protein
MTGGIQNISAESAIQIAGSPLLPWLSWEQKEGLSEQSTVTRRIVPVQLRRRANSTEKSRNLQNIVLTFLGGFL